MNFVIRKKLSNGWTIIEIPSPSYQGHNHYYYQGKRAPVVKVGEEKIITQYAGYTLIEKDLRSIIVWLNEIEKLKPEHHTRYENANKMDLIKGYFVAALTFYGKCFTESKGRKIKYDRNNVPVEHRDTHDIIMEMRNNFTAHSGIGYESVRVSLVLHPDINSDAEPELYTELRQPDFNNVLSKEMITIVKLLQEQTLAKRSSIGKKFLNDVVHPKGKIYWYTKGTYDKADPKDEIIDRVK